MKIAIPLSAGSLAEHFGHCEQFALIEADPGSKRVLSQSLVVPPPHEPGLLPRWLHEQGVQVVIAGGMGQRALELFAQKGIAVHAGTRAIHRTMQHKRFWTVLCAAEPPIVNTTTPTLTGYENRYYNDRP